MSESCLFGFAWRRISAAMFARPLLIPLLLLTLTLPAVAQPHKPAPAHAAPAAHPAPASGPKSIGKFDDWTAATHMESGQTVCYAFARAESSSPAVPGRGQVVLTVAERPAGRDAVAMEAGFTYAANATVTMQVDQGAFDFYTSQRNAFARDGKALIAAFQKGDRAIARSPGPKNAKVTDTFSLKGFSAAYAAITKACPAK
jgi:invasion protein IalB